jgi:hypothetical protein
MEAHQERLVVEKRELGEKIDKLDAFINGHVFGGIPKIEQDLLQLQVIHMRAYSEILGERIAAFQ